VRLLRHSGRAAEFADGGPLQRATARAAVVSLAGLRTVEPTRTTVSETFSPSGRAPWMSAWALSFLWPQLTANR